MAKRVPKPYTIVEHNGQEARLYEDGTIRNERGQALALPPALQNHAITPDNAYDMLRQREEKRVRLYNLGANRVVHDASLLHEFGADAHLVERAMTLQTIASTPDAGKAAVLADVELRKAQGYTADKAQAAEAQDAPVTRELVALLEAMRRRVEQRVIVDE